MEYRRVLFRCGKQPVRVSNIDPKVTYYFSFLNDKQQNPAIYGITFRADLIEWMKENPARSVKLIDAIHSGATGRSALKGIRPLPLWNSEKDVYEAKILERAGYRMILIRNGNLFEAVAAVPHDKVKRFVKAL